MNKLLALLTLLAVIFSVSPSHAQMIPTDPLDGIVAVVDEDVILRSELDRAINGVVTQYAANPQQLPPRAVLERQVLDRLIMTKLQIERADSTGVKLSDAEVDQTVAQIAEQNRMDVNQLRQAVQQQGLSWEQFRQTVHDETLVQRLRQRVVQSRVQVSDTEIELMVKAGGVKRGELHLGHILIGVPDGASSTQIDAAASKAEDVSRQISGGMDFAAAAIRYSDAPNALEGGDLGWRGYDSVPSAFAEIAEKLQPGQTAPPIRGPNGFHLIKLIERRDAQPQMVTEYHARHILIKTGELVSSDEAERAIQNIRQRIVDGEDFAKLAKEFSEDGPTANLGGDMNWFPQDGYGARVGGIITTLKDGELSQPFETQIGWHLMQRLASRTEDRSSEAARDQARQTLGARKADEEYESFLRQVRSEAYIDIRLPEVPDAGPSGVTP